MFCLNNNHRAAVNYGPMKPCMETLPDEFPDGDRNFVVKLIHC
ncbi:Uncharacterised protein [Ewingella americana]|uniref:Uncharacterized protein n=1 Tax=Ewingella americana TaxID=41202 RepID=A0A377N8X7_9GAMM|nr:Uncharacterised protein [Ewingella americana]